MFLPHLTCRPYPVKLPSFEIGAFTYIANDLELRTYLPHERIIIGSYCSIGDQVLITTGGLHRSDAATTYPFSMLKTYVSTPNTTIGSDVWIGTRAMVRGGVTVGHGAIIGSGAVVFEHVPPFAIAVGNPAAVVRYRFSKPMVERMLRIAWWEWPPVKVFANVEWFYAPIQDFVDRFDPGGTSTP
jgi:virginiamycin A acetyltransferase